MGKSLMSCHADNATFARSARRQLSIHPSTGQRGTILFFTLIALVVMTLAAIALVRSVDTSISIAGNAAFKQATVQAGDVGIEIAAAALPGILSVSADKDIPNQYFALEQAVDTAGLPTTINWATVPCRSTSGATLSGCDDHSLYRIQYVIDRLCSALPGADTRANCVAQDPKDNSSKKSNSPVFTTATKIYYRATVRVQGPRNATSIIQGTLGY